MKIQYVFLVTLFFLSCIPKTDFNFHGYWQSLNEGNLTILIGDNFEYELIRDGLSFFSRTDDESPTISIQQREKNWYSFQIIYAYGEDMVRGRIETVNKDRMRIYFHKHHDILDLADEFHRAKDTNSFDNLMDSIRTTME